MKFKITIPAQSLKIEIPAQEIEVELTPIVPPIVIPPTEPIEPPIEPEPIDNFEEYFYNSIVDPSVNAIKIDSDHRIEKIKTTPINRELRIYSDNNSILVTGIENYTKDGSQDGHLFDLKDGARIFIDGVNICPPPQLKTSQPWTPSLFKAPQDANAKWVVCVRNCDTTLNGRNPGFGLGFLYGGIRENLVILQNFKHCGPGLMDAKNPYSNSVLQVVMENVTTDFENEEDFGSAKILCKGLVKNRVFTITSEDVTTEAFYSDYNFGAENSNFCFIIHIGRFTFLWEGKEANIDLKNIDLRPIPSNETVFAFVDQGRLFIPDTEAHAGQTFSYNGQTYTLVKKDRTDYPEWMAWGTDPKTRKNLQLAFEISPSLPDGDYNVFFNQFALDLPNQDAYLIYKGNSRFPTTVNTPFGNDHNVMLADITGHLCYNHAQVSIWAKNTALNGYYRQSDDGKGINKGVNLIDCKGFDDQFGPSVPVTHDANIPMPIEAQQVLEYLDSL